MHTIINLEYSYSGGVVSCNMLKRVLPKCQFSPSHLEGSSTSVGRPGHCQSPVLAVENVDVRQRILFDVPPDGVHVS